MTMSNAALYAESDKGRGEADVDSVAFCLRASFRESRVDITIPQKRTCIWNEEDGSMVLLRLSFYMRPARLGC
jgi:hypothetical protein